MKEVVFIRQNMERWQQTEALLDDLRSRPAEEVADAYVEITSDLAYAQTHYPNARITAYLNGLAATLHNELHASRRERWSRLKTFWSKEVPLTMWQERRWLLRSLLVFLMSAAIGVVSQLGDSEFCRIIMGDGYVDMTLNNIAKGEPMGVYGNESEATMFLGITLNNIYVSFIIYVMGLFTSFGTGYFLLQNGVMLGCFQAFFFQHGLGLESMLAIWMHGTLEISAIIVAGAAGLVLGAGWLFPGTDSRGGSFRRAARRSQKIVVGTVPLFVVAAFIEGFCTRHTEWPDAVRLAIILASLGFVVYYYAYLPNKLNKQLWKEKK